MLNRRELLKALGLAPFFFDADLLTRIEFAAIVDEAETINAWQRPLGTLPTDTEVASDKPRTFLVNKSTGDCELGVTDADGIYHAFLLLKPGDWFEVNRNTTSAFHARARCDTATLSIVTFD